MTLAEIIFERIAPAILERVVQDQGILGEDTRSRLFKASGLPQKEVARLTVEAYGDQSGALAQGLYDQVAQHDFFAANELAVHFRARPDSGYLNHQASLVARFPTLPIDQLDEFLTAVRRQVCLIVVRTAAGGPIARGTGFLVAPSYVLTCRHVLNLPKPLPPGARVELYFDFFRGEPVEDVGQVPPQSRKVGLADDWYDVSSNPTDPDGVVGELTAADVARISASLDFVLLKLDQPVGLQPLSRNGGRRRGWVQLAPDEVPKKLAEDDWIIIPQHPNGFPQRIDLGRFLTPDQTATRIRYRANTAKGSSGAPCFTFSAAQTLSANRKFNLVGVHNAYVGPSENPVANQAIRFDHIAAQLRALPDFGKPFEAFVLRWSVSRDGESPRVIIGRDALLEWLRNSAKPTPATLAERVYAAQAAAPGAGCSFSIDVLNAETLGSKAPRVIYGERGQVLPATAEDFLLSLLRELGVRDLTKAEKMPERPRSAARTGAVPAIIGEVDKLDRWLSVELPSWLGRVLMAHVERTIDAREVARESLAVYAKQGLDPPEDLEKQARASEPVLVRPQAWDVAYVVLDDLRPQVPGDTRYRTDLGGEVQSLIAALVRGKPETIMDTGLRRLRWMFLGYLPDFISAADTDGNGATLEVLDASLVGLADVMSTFRRLAETQFPMKEVLGLQATAELVVDMAGASPENGSRLAALQKWASKYTASLLRDAGLT